MKSLYPLRHAKSSWGEPHLGDQQQLLNKRNSRDASMMGERFNERGKQLGHIVSSLALRARSRAQLFAEACIFSSGGIEINPDLYFLGSGSIEEVILEQGNRLGQLMLVFHNPDITQIANSIDYEFHVDNIPICGLVKLSCDIA
jgi:phosphohistidine phosphatase